MVTFKEVEKVTTYESLDGMYKIIDDNGVCTIEKAVDGVNERLCDHGWDAESLNYMYFDDPQEAFARLNNMLIDEHKIGEVIDTIHGKGTVVLNERYTEDMPYKVEFSEGVFGYLKLDELL